MRKSFSVVIADDDIDDHQLMKDGLRECKVKLDISSVYNGVQLMDFLEHHGAYKNIKHLPNLILLDLNMPLMDGFDALQRIRSKPEYNEIAVYVITTSRNSDHMKKALKLGANGFYTKGASSKEILGIMKELCKECFAKELKPSEKERGE